MLAVGFDIKLVEDSVYICQVVEDSNSIHRGPSWCIFGSQ